VVLLLVPGLALAQGAKSFRLTWNVEKSGPISTEVAGQVVNDSRLDAFDVYVTVEALDDKGKVVARGLTHVSPLMRASASEAFVAKVPVVPGIASYRVLVSSFRFGLGASQAP
jgi:precorrin-6B methylase 1